jgi:hypothetical protein
VKYTPSALVSEFSGKQGSTVASHNRNGPYFRNRTIPVNRNSATQQTARNNFKSGSQGWKALSEAQRTAWRTAADLVVLIDRLGAPYTPTGQQYYVSVVRTIYVYDSTAALPTVPPSATAPVALLTVTLTVTP